MVRKNVDTLLRDLGNPGRYQILLFFLLAFQYIPLSFNALNTIFTGGRPAAVKCGNLMNESTHGDLCSTEIDFKKGDLIRTCSKNEKDVFRNVSLRNSSSGILCTPCAMEFVYDSDKEITFVGEFGLICEDYWLTSLGPTLFFLGAMFGGSAFGIISDKYGRKKAVIIASTFSLGAGLGVTFIPSFVGFAIFRFLLGFGIQGAALTAFTLVMESFSKNYREYAGVGAQLVWATGVILLSAISYGVPDWRYLQLISSLTVLIAAFYICFIRESLRWLFTNGKFQEAEDVVNHILRFNNIPRTKKISDCVEYLHIWYQKEPELEEESGYPLWNLFTSRELRKRVLGMTYVWFTASIWYYVLSFAIMDFFGSPHLNLAIGGLIDIPITIATMFIVSRFGCRWPLIYFCAIGAVLSVITGCVPQTTIARTVFGQIARGTTHASFNIMMPFASELLPTVVRNNGLGVCSFGMRLGGVLAPLLLLLGSYTIKELPFFLCGVMGLVAAVVTYFMPETRGISLPETVEELELPESYRARGNYSSASQRI